MKLAVDTNILLRVILRDDPRQAAMAERLLARADVLFISTIVLCELVWVLDRRGFNSIDIHQAVTAFVEPEKVEVDHPVVQSGLAILRQGGSFADGCILQMARSRGAQLATFDRELIALSSGDAVAANSDLLGQT